MSNAVPKISDTELMELIQTARRRRGGKATKYTSLEVHRESIMEMMRMDIQLPIILGWLKEKHQVDVVLNTLRKYIVKRIGRAPYDEYLLRNGWKKTRRAPRASAVAVDVESAHGAIPSQSVNDGFKIDFKPPVTFRRTNRS